MGFDTTPPIKTRPLLWLTLFTNHADAWVTTLAISVVALIIHQRLTPENALLSLAIAGGYWLAFAINDFFDTDVDQLDPIKKDKNFFVLFPIGNKLFSAGAVAISLLLFPIFAQYRWRGLIVVLISVIVMWGYSAPPLRLKNRPGIDILAHACFVQTFPYAATVFMIGAEWLAVDRVLLILGVLTSSGAQLEQQIRDAADDKQFGQTFALIIGPSNALILLKILTGAGIVYGLYHIISGTIPLLVAPLGLIALPAVIPRFWRQVNQPRPEKMIRVLIFIGVIYMIFMVVTFFKGFVS
ncbi:MAG: UbiA family prenyltransferase [Ardenticatenaceae bacterium]|nr:UbiA family prenyltransferase [Ardenticatenaceae bacterium]